MMGFKMWKVENKGQQGCSRGVLQINTTYFTILPRASLGVKVWGRDEEK